MPGAALPPEDLIRRVGWTVHADRPGDVFEERGLLQWRLIKSLLPAGWSAEGREILDFGCGVGRIMLPALREDPGAAFWGCDPYEPSVSWLRSQVPDAGRIMLSGEWPPLPVADRAFDLVYAFSVFTHLMDSWSAWLVELARVLKDDGVMVLTVFGPGHEAFGDEPTPDESTGMNVLYPNNDWDIGGPLIVHSEWWLRARWGRVFEILELRDGDPAGSPPLFGQGVVVLRKRPGVTATVPELERPEAGEPREVEALRANVASLRRELTQKIEMYESSASWRATAPLRRIGAAVRRVRSR